MKKIIAASVAVAIIALAALVAFSPITEKQSFAQTNNSTTTITGNAATTTTGNVSRTTITGNATTTTPTNATKAVSTNATTTTAAVASQAQNQSMHIVRGNVSVLTLNNTVIPLQKTIIQKQTMTKSVDNNLLSQLGSMTLTAAVQGNKTSSLGLSNIQNQTATIATGQATTTIVSKTIIPYNVTVTQLSLSSQNHTTVSNTTPSKQDVQQLFQASPSGQNTTTTTK
jgi:hypothetical protein